MGQLTAIETEFASKTITQALGDEGVQNPSENPLSKLLMRDAEIAMDGQVASVRIRQEGRGSIPLADRIAEIKTDHLFAWHFPKGPGRISKDDMRTMSANFDEIAAGRVKVVD